MVEREAGNRDWASRDTPLGRFWKNLNEESFSQDSRRELPELKIRLIEKRILEHASVGSGALICSEFIPQMLGKHEPEGVATHHSYEPFIRFEPPELPGNIVLLTPRETTHPIFRGAVERALLDLRTFSFPLPEFDRKQQVVAPSLVVKGGDLLFPEGVERGARRSLIDQMPGLGVLSRLEDQYENASMLHGLSIGATGTLAGVPVPHSIRQIIDVPSRSGGLVPIREFLNSDEYLQPDAELTFELGLLKDKGLGDYLMEERGLIPAEYLYIIDGTNLRCREALSLLVYNHHCNLSRKDPLMRDHLAIANGTAMEFKGHSRDAVLRGTYRLLGDTWNIPIESFLPVEAVRDEEYGQVLTTLRKGLADYDVSRLILSPFIERITETMALAHSHGWSFSHPDAKLAGSLHPRNVTISGTVCDLDTMTFGNFPFFKKDIGEAMTSIAAIQRMVSFWSPSESGYSEHVPESGRNFVDLVLERYRDYTSNYCQEDKRLLSQLHNLSRSEYLYERLLDIFYAHERPY